MDAVNGQPEPAPAIDAAPAPADEPPPPPAAPDLSEPTPLAAAASGRTRGRTVRRFAAAFLFGVLGVLAVSAGALAAFESSNAGRILPGVHVGSVDLSGLTPAEARVRLVEGYAGLADGALILVAGDTTQTVAFSAVGRRLDVDAVVAAAMSVGRSGATIERIAANVRNMVRGVDVSPLATFEPAALRREIQSLAAGVDVAAESAAVALAGEDFVVSSGRDGRAANVDAAVRAATTLLADPAAPASLRVTIPLEVVEPTVTTSEARAARDAAGWIALDVMLVDGPESWVLQGAAFRGWISFVVTAEGGYVPVVAQAGLEAGLTEIAADVARAPVDASFLVGDGNQVVGVTEGKNGRALDVPGTVETLVRLVEQRSHGLTVSRAPITSTTLEPDLTTAEATQTAPLMAPISEWTTYFPIGIKNGQGVNIWIPARDIDGYVVMPGQWFDFWKAIGPVTRERGYKDGGAIINGRTEPQGALAGGICSTSTTLFNAAIRAGLEMGARRNHYYYIDRYPIGLDATVFQSGSGSVQTMSFRNDTDQPLLIRSQRWSVGSKGYVKFVIWSVPGARDVDFSAPIIKNVKKASDTVVYTTELAPGVKERVEFPVDGKDVWVTRTVRDAQGVIIHQETYYSHYARITGIVRIGIAPAPAPDPTPTPEPSPAP
jgi:vancomycin resistance protein YoaR